MDAKKARIDLLGQKVVSALKERHFEAYYEPDNESAVKRALSLIPEGSSVTWGGSMTIEEIGLKAALGKGKYVVYDRDKAKNDTERGEILRKAFFADFFISSANAISENGVIYNIDRTGNRLAAICYGPKNVLIIAGINKIAGSESSALERARKTAAPINAMRFDIKTPCKETGVCMDCKSPDTICSKILTLRCADFPGRIKVIIVGEESGF